MFSRFRCASLSSSTLLTLPVLRRGYSSKPPKPFHYQPIVDPERADSIPWKKIAEPDNFVEVQQVGDREILTIKPQALTLLTREAFKDVSHLLRPGHLAQLRKILEDTEASSNDKFVALELLKNANIAAGMVLPGCQDTGTAIVMGKKGENVWVDSAKDDEEAISRGIYETYTQTNLRYSQMAPLDMYTEVNT